MLLIIANYADESGFAFPGVPLLARMSRMSERNAQKVIDKLERARELEVIKGGGMKTASGPTNGYQINMNAERGVKTCSPDAVNKSTPPDVQAVNARTSSGELQGQSGERTDVQAVNASSPKPPLEPSMNPPLEPPAATRTGAHESGQLPAAALETQAEKSSPPNSPSEKASALISNGGQTPQPPSSAAPPSPAPEGESDVLRVVIAAEQWLGRPISRDESSLIADDVRDFGVDTVLGAIADVREREAKGRHKAKFYNYLTPILRERQQKPAKPVGYYEAESANMPRLPLPTIDHEKVLAKYGITPHAATS